MNPRVMGPYRYSRVILTLFVLVLVQQCASLEELWLESSLKVSTCDTFTVVAHSTAARPLHWRWSCSTVRDDIFVSDLNNICAQTNGSRLVIPGDTIGGHGEVVVLQIEARAMLYRDWVSAYLDVTLTPFAVPQISMNVPSKLNIHLHESIVLSADAYTSACSPATTSRVPLFWWNVTSHIGGEELDPAYQRQVNMAAYNLAKFCHEWGGIRASASTECSERLPSVEVSGEHMTLGHDYTFQVFACDMACSEKSAPDPWKSCCNSATVKVSAADPKLFYNPLFSTKIVGPSLVYHKEPFALRVFMHDFPNASRSVNDHLWWSPIAHLKKRLEEQAFTNEPCCLWSCEEAAGFTRCPSKFFETQCKCDLNDIRLPVGKYKLLLTVLLDFRAGARPSASHELLVERADIYPLPLTDVYLELSTTDDVFFAAGHGLLYRPFQPTKILIHNVEDASLRHPARTADPTQLGWHWVVDRRPWTLGRATTDGTEKVPTAPTLYRYPTRHRHYLSGPALDSLKDGWNVHHGVLIASEDLLPGMYEARLCSSHLQAPVVARLSFNVSAAPHGGRCWGHSASPATIVETPGDYMAMVWFVLYCDDWEDPLGLNPLSYSFAYKPPLQNGQHLIFTNNSDGSNHPSDHAPLCNAQRTSYLHAAIPMEIGCPRGSSDQLCGVVTLSARVCNKQGLCAVQVFQVAHPTHPSIAQMYSSVSVLLQLKNKTRYLHTHTTALAKQRAQHKTNLKGRDEWDHSKELYGRCDLDTLHGANLKKVDKIRRWFSTLSPDQALFDALKFSILGTVEENEDVKRPLFEELFAQVEKRIRKVNDDDLNLHAELDEDTMMTRDKNAPRRMCSWVAWHQEYQSPGMHDETDAGAEGTPRAKESGDEFDGYESSDDEDMAKQWNAPVQMTEGTLFCRSDSGTVAAVRQLGYLAEYFYSNGTQTEEYYHDFVEVAELLYEVLDMHISPWESSTAIHLEAPSDSTFGVANMVSMLFRASGYHSDVGQLLLRDSLSVISKSLGPSRACCPVDPVSSMDLPYVGWMHQDHGKVRDRSDFSPAVAGMWNSCNMVPKECVSLDQSSLILVTIPNLLDLLAQPHFISTIVDTGQVVFRHPAFFNLLDVKRHEWSATLDRDAHFHLHVFTNTDFSQRNATDVTYGGAIELKNDSLRSAQPAFSDRVIHSVMLMRSCASKSGPKNKNIKAIIVVKYPKPSEVMETVLHIDDDPASGTCSNTPKRGPAIGKSHWHRRNADHGRKKRKLLSELDEQKLQYYKSMTPPSSYAMTILFPPSDMPSFFEVSDCETGTVEPTSGPRWWDTKMILPYCDCEPATVPDDGGETVIGWSGKGGNTCACRCQIYFERSSWPSNDYFEYPSYLNRDQGGWMGRFVFMLDVTAVGDPYGLASFVDLVQIRPDYVITVLLLLLSPHVYVILCVAFVSSSRKDRVGEQAAHQISKSAARPSVFRHLLNGTGFKIKKLLPKSWVWHMAVLLRRARGLMRRNSTWWLISRTLAPEKIMLVTKAQYAWLLTLRLSLELALTAAMLDPEHQPHVWTLVSISITTSALVSPFDAAVVNIAPALARIGSPIWWRIFWGVVASVSVTAAYVATSYCLRFSVSLLIVWSLTTATQDVAAEFVRVVVQKMVHGPAHVVFAAGKVAFVWMAQKVESKLLLPDVTAPKDQHATSVEKQTNADGRMITEDHQNASGAVTGLRRRKRKKSAKKEDKDHVILRDTTTGVHHERQVIMTTPSAVQTTYKRAQDTLQTPAIRGSQQIARARIPKITSRIRSTPSQDVNDYAQKAVDRLLESAVTVADRPPVAADDHPQLSPSPERLTKLELNASILEETTAQTTASAPTLDASSRPGDSVGTLSLPSIIPVDIQPSTFFSTESEALPSSQRNINGPVEPTMQPDIRDQQMLDAQGDSSIAMSPLKPAQTRDESHAATQVAPNSLSWTGSMPKAVPVRAQDFPQKSLTNQDQHIEDDVSGAAAQFALEKQTDHELFSALFPTDPPQKPADVGAHYGIQTDVHPPPSSLPLGPDASQNAVTSIHPSTQPAANKVVDAAVFVPASDVSSSPTHRAKETSGPKTSSDNEVRFSVDTSGSHGVAEVPSVKSAVSKAESPAPTSAKLSSSMPVLHSRSILAPPPGGYLTSPPGIPPPPQDPQHPEATMQSITTQDGVAASALRKSSESMQTLWVAGPMLVFEPLRKSTSSIPPQGSSSLPEGKWNVRYCSLRYPGDLRYYRRYEDFLSGSPPVSAVTMSLVTDIGHPHSNALPRDPGRRGRDCVIQLVLPRRQHFFAARSKKDFHTWWTAIQMHLEAVAAGHHLHRPRNKPQLPDAAESAPPTYKGARNQPDAAKSREMLERNFVEAIAGSSQPLTHLPREFGRHLIGAGTNAYVMDQPLPGQPPAAGPESVQSYSTVSSRGSLNSSQYGPVITADIIRGAVQRYPERRSGVGSDAQKLDVSNEAAEKMDEHELSVMRMLGLDNPDGAPELDLVETGLPQQQRLLEGMVPPDVASITSSSSSGRAPASHGGSSSVHSVGDGQTTQMIVTTLPAPEGGVTQPSGVARFSGEVLQFADAPRARMSLPPATAETPGGEWPGAGSAHTSDGKDTGTIHQSARASGAASPDKAGPATAMGQGSPPPPGFQKFTEPKDRGLPAPPPGFH